MKVRKLGEIDFPVDADGKMMIKDDEAKEDEYEEDEYEELSEKFISCIDGESEMNSLNSSSEQDL